MAHPDAGVHIDGYSSRLGTKAECQILPETTLTLKRRLLKPGPDCVLVLPPAGGDLDQGLSMNKEKRCTRCGARKDVILRVLLVGSEGGLTVADHQLVGGGLVVAVVVL